MLFKIFIKDLDTGPEGTLNNCAKLGEGVDSLEGRKALQRDLDKLEDWIITNHVKFNKGKCSILHMGGATLDVWTDWGMRCWRAVLQKETWGSWSVASCTGVSSALAARRAKHVLGVIRHSIASWARKGIVPSALHWGSLTSSAGGIFGCPNI